jgi:membrane protein implicated in regulation of membrane protease activity
MWGKWFTSVMAVAGVILLIVGLLAAFSALAAVGIAAVVIAIILYALAVRRSGQVGAERRSAAEERRRAGQGTRAGASGAPRSGEGDVDAAAAVRTTGGRYT